MKVIKVKSCASCPWYFHCGCSFTDGDIIPEDCPLEEEK